jgi:hypothetical protein
MLFLVLSFCCFSLDLNDILFGVFASEECFITRIIPMANAWYQFVPEVHIMIDAMSEPSLSALKNNTHSNLFFHVTSATAHFLVGSEFYTPWNVAQSRHITGLAHLYELYPNKTYYAICDDDTYMFTENLMLFLEKVDPAKPKIYGHTFLAASFGHVFFRYKLSDSVGVFNHGGSGMVFSKGVMDLLGPKLRDCNVFMDTANFGSDERIGACASRLGDSIASEVCAEIHGFNPVNFADMLDLLDDRSQITFHHVKESGIAVVFNSSVTVIDDYYYDWSSFSFRTFRAPLAPFEFIGDVIFGYGICYGDLRRCAIAETQFEVINHSVYSFRQQYKGGYSIYVRCVDTINDSVVAFGGVPPPPEPGVVLDLKCPQKKKFLRTNKPNDAPIAIDHDDVDII